MSEKKLFNAYESLKNFDTSSKKNLSFLRYFFINTGYTEEEWQEYIKAKETCQTDEEWKRTRSEKHYQMAKAYAIAV